MKSKRGVLALLAMLIFVMPLHMPNLYTSEVTVRIDGVPMQFDVQSLFMMAGLYWL